MRTILVPFDGSTLGAKALHPAARLAARSQARIMIAGVHKPEMPVRGGQGAMMFDPRWDDERRARLAAELESARARLQADVVGVEVRSTLLEGDPATALAELATSAGADLVALATHGRGGLRRAWLGSVTDSLLRRLTIPVLVIHAAESRRARPASDSAPLRLLVPFGDMVDGAAAINAALAVFGTKGVEYDLLRVEVPLHPTVGELVPPEELSRMSAEQRERSARELSAAMARLHEHGATAHASVRADLNAAEAILEEAKESSASTIALAAHGKGLWGRIVSGSVADHVIRRATVPVLVQPVVSEEEAAERAADLETASR